ncbi:MAG: DUF1292 domain-containing protein [Saccharofermentans sp.]|nr:DUF1292 domain-containing protein [Saccharofermentans sp.]
MKNQTNKTGIGNVKKKRAVQQSRKAKAAGEHLKNSSGDELIVIRDPYNKKDYYLSVIDTFVILKREYVVMHNYVPDDGNHDKPELVIMRTEYSKNGEQLFYSIKDGTELETAFTFFMRRFYDAQSPDVKVRSGVKTGGN